VVKKLAGQIDTELSKFTLKKNSLILTLVKKDSSSWSEINFKEEKVVNFLCSIKKRKTNKVKLIQMLP
jgi:hypothetical protein